MKKTKTNASLLLYVLCAVLLAAAVLYASGVLGGKKEAPAAGPAVVQDGDVVGRGNREFSFVICDGDGQETAITVKTDKQMVGEALKDENIIEGEVQEYGLYVKKVNGITADYDIDQTYWAFYIDGAYAMQSVDMTEIQDGSIYMMKVEK